VCPLAKRAFSGPRRRTGRVLALRPGSGDRPVRVRAQGPRRSARSARSIHHSLPLLFTRLTGRAGGWWARRGRGRGGRWVAGDPCAPGPRRRGRPRSGHPQAPLEDVEKIATPKCSATSRSKRDCDSAGAPRPRLRAPWGMPEHLFPSDLETLTNCLEQTRTAGLPTPGADRVRTHRRRAGQRCWSQGRRKWDSNPRDPLGSGDFQGRCLRPLGHSSAGSLLTRRWAYPQRVSGAQTRMVSGLDWPRAMSMAACSSSERLWVDWPPLTSLA
jgi:hypothetical protein